MKFKGLISLLLVAVMVLSPVLAFASDTVQIQNLEAEINSNLAALVVPRYESEEERAILEPFIMLEGNDLVIVERAVLELSETELARLQEIVDERNATLYHASYSGLALLDTIDEFTIVEHNDETVILRAREGNTTVTLNYDIQTNYLTLISQEITDSAPGIRRGANIDISEASFYLEVDSESLLALNTFEHNGTSYYLPELQTLVEHTENIADLYPLPQEGAIVALSISISLTAILGAALIRALVAAVLTIVVGGVTFVAGHAVTQELSRRRPNNHFMAVLRNGRLYIGNGVTLAVAQARLRGRQDVWSLTSVLARRAAGGTTAEGPENHFRRGSRHSRFFDHWHIAGRRGGHSFFGHGRPGAL